MANEFIVRKGLIVYGSGSSTVLDVQGSQGQLFSITDSLTGSIFSANDISGIPVIEAFSDNTVKLGTFGAEGIIVSGSFAYVTGSVTGSFTGSLLGTASWANNASTASFVLNAISSSFASTASYVNPLRQDVIVTGSLFVSSSNQTQLQVGTNLVFVSSSGNVGFGTSTPIERVHVVGNITGSGTLGIRNRTTLWGDVALYGGNSNTTIGLDYIYTGSLLGKSNVLHFRQGGSTAGAIMFTYYGTNPMLTMIPSDFASARVGINTPNPQATLHVSGSSGSVVFEVDSNSSPNIIYASGSGNVGFGTSTPQYKLDVSGSGNFTNNLTVTGSLIAPSITGSLFGTSSWSNNAISSSYAQTASFVLNAISSSFASTASYVNPLRQDVIVTGSLNVSGSTIIKGGLTVDDANDGDMTFGSRTLSVNNTTNPFYISHTNAYGGVMFNYGPSSKNLFGFGGDDDYTNGRIVMGNWTSVNYQNANSSSYDVPYGTFHLYSRTGENAFNITTQDGTANFLAHAKNAIGSLQNISFNNNYVYISSSGNVGFGTSTPTEKVHVVGNGLFTGDLTVQGKITAEEFHTEFVSASIIYRSGSTKFGDTSDDTHQFTGSLRVNGSITGSLFGTASYATQALSASYSLSSSYAITSSHALNVSVRTAGGSLYSFNPSTSNFSETDGIFLGTNAGFNASQAEGAVMLGTDAGQGATNAESSIMIGASAGSGAPYANNSVLIGSSAGFSASNAQYSTFIGQGAGYSASNAQYSSFYGFQAGYNAVNASQSVFIGYDAGVSSTNAVESVFAGYRAGAGAANANYSVMIGSRAGYSNNIGRNNILIGTGVTLPSGSQNKINIAGLVFGSGSYFDASNTSSGSANGKVGINQPNPQYSFDVSGSGNYTNNLYVTGALRITGSATINNYTLPLTDGTNKQIIITDGLGNLAFDFNRTLYEEVKNVSGGTLAKGTPVHVVSTTGNTNNVIAASASLASSMPATFILDQALNNDEEGLGIILGHINGVNTSAFTEGDVVYVGENGGYTNVKPTGSNLIQPLGIVIAVDASNGSGLVMNPGVTNDVPNLLNGQIFWGQGNTAIQKPLGDILSGSAYAYSGSFTGSLLGTSSYATEALSASLATSASYYPIKVSGSTIYSADPATSGFNTTGAVIIGPNSVGQNSTNSQFAVMVGAAAGQNATTSQYAVMIGTSAGNGASNSEYGVMLGRWAGSSATNASSSVMVGREAGRNATNTTLSTFVGPYAGFTATNARNSTFIGNQAGYNATNANDSVFIGTNAGYAATNAIQSLFYGPNAGYQASAATLSSFIGNESGYNAISASYSVFIGNVAGQNATSASFSTFVGRSAGQAATKANRSTFIGSAAGAAATFANNAIMVGNGAGENAASASYSILIGNYAGSPTVAANTIGSYNIVIGTGISVPVNATRALNIGGLIFGTGSYATANLDAFSGSANGRVGINQPLPQKEFDISGSLRISRLSTSLTAPVTSGTTKMVITDANGDLSFTDPCCTGSIKIAAAASFIGTSDILNFTGAGVTATISGGTASISIPGGGSGDVKIIDESSDLGGATYLKFTGAGVTTSVTDSTASISIPGGSGDTFPYTGSAIISGSLIVTGSVSVLGTTTYRKVVENQNSGYTITSQDFGKTFICNSSTAQTFNLPSANTADIGFEVTIIKYGEGKITIDASGSDVIQDSGAGGTIYCSDTGIASITLLIPRTSAWVITSAVGTWITTD